MAKHVPTKTQIIDKKTQECSALVTVQYSPDRCRNLTNK